MNDDIRRARFNEVATRELNGGQLRQPVWNQALIDAGNNPDEAGAFYQKRRVDQMLADEDDRENEDGRARLRVAAMGGLTFAQKNVLLGMGIILILLFWLARTLPH